MRIIWTLILSCTKGSLRSRWGSIAPCFFNPNHIMRFFSSAGTILLGALGIIFVCIRCNKVDSFGGELVEDERLALQSRLIDSFEFESVPIPDLLMYVKDSLAGWDFTSPSNSFLIGDLEDPFLGSYRTEAYVQYVNFGRASFDSDVAYVIDSVFLSIPYDTAFGIYGDATSTYDLHVYELEEAMSASRYYTNTALMSSATPLGSVLDFRPSPKMGELVINNSDTTEAFPRIKIPLSHTIGERVVALDSLGQDSVEFFLNDVFKGVKITMNRKDGDGGIVRMQVPSILHTLSIYYHHPDSTGSERYDLTPYRRLTANDLFGTRFAVYSQVSRGEPSEILDDKHLYISNLGGGIGKLTINKDLPFYDSINVIDAFVEIPLNEGVGLGYDTSLYLTNSQLIPVVRGSDKDFFVPTLDYIQNRNSIGTQVVSIDDNGVARDAFRIRISLHLNQLLSGETDENEIYFVDPQMRTTPYSAIVNGPMASDYPMYLSVLYSTKMTN